MKILYKFLLVGGLLGLFSCNDFLELPPTYQENSATFYTTEADFNTAVLGCYDDLQKIYSTNQSGGFWIFSDLTTDIAEVQNTSSANWTAFDDFNLFSNNPHLVDFWNASYNTIFRCNLILDKLPASSFEETSKNKISAETKLIRGLVYFNLVRIFGDVPLVDKTLGISESYEYLRESKDLVYDLIIADFSFARENLPESWTGSNLGRATKDAATGLLGKVYLTLNDYPAARDFFKELIDGNKYKLMDAYADVFSLNYPNLENIFEIHYAANSNGEGSRFFQVFMPQGTIDGQGQGYCVPTPHLVNAFELGDQRKDYMIVQDLPGSIIPGSLGAYKYRDAQAGTSDGGNNWIVVRYADVLLSYAEAENKIAYGNALALEALNDVRKRVGLAEKSYDELNSQQLFDLAIERERMVELAFEGHRWFDLVRRNRAIEVMNNEYEHPMNVTITEKNLLFPIPLSVINTNSKITQNPGYNY